MKNILIGLLFWTICIGFILAMFAIAEFLASVVTIDMIMTVAYTVLGICFIYILRS